jgi:hypothetical protein
MTDYNTTIHLNIKVTINSKVSLSAGDIIGIIDELEYDLSSDDENVNYFITEIEGFST